MAAGGPWSVKGIDPRARETAREAARREGKTLGEWLNAIILEGDEPEPQPRGSAADIPHSARFDEPYHGRHGRYEDDAAFEGLGDYDDDLIDRLKALSKRLEAAEHRSTLAITGMDQSILGLIARLERTEQTAKDSAGRAEDGMDELRGAHETLAGRLQALEQDDTAETVKSLEDAVATVAGHVHQKDQRTQSHFQTVEERLETLAGKLEKATDNLTRRVDASSDHASMKARRETETVRQELETFRENGQQALADLKDSVDRINQRLGSAERLTDNAVRALEASFASLDDRLTKTEGAVAENTEQGVAQRLDERFASLSGELKSMIEASRQETAQSLAEAASDSRLDRLQQSLEESDKRHGETLAQIGDKIALLGEAVEKRMRQTERSLRDEALQERNMEARLRDIETQSANAVRRVGEEVEQVSQKLTARIEASEDRNASAVASLSDQIESLRESRSRDDDEALERRLRDSEERTQQMIREAVAGVGAKIDTVRDENETALSPVQNALSNLARRLEDIETRRAEPEMPRAEDALAVGGAASIPDDEPFFVDEMEDAADYDLAGEETEAAEPAESAGTAPEYEEEVALTPPAPERRNPFGAVYELEDEDDAAVAGSGGDAPESDPFFEEPPQTESDSESAQAADEDPEDNHLNDEDQSELGAAAAVAPAFVVAEAHEFADLKTEPDADDGPEELFGPAPRIEDEGEAQEAALADDAAGITPEPEPEPEPEEPRKPAPLGATADLGFLAAARNAARNAPDASAQQPNSTILDSKQQRGGGSAARRILVATGALATLTLGGAAALLLLDTRPSGSSPRVAGTLESGTLENQTVGEALDAAVAAEETQLAAAGESPGDFEPALQEPADADAAVAPDGTGASLGESGAESADIAVADPAADDEAAAAKPTVADESADDTAADETQLAQAEPSPSDPDVALPEAEITAGAPQAESGGSDATDIALASLEPAYQFQLGLAELQAGGSGDGVRLVRSAAEAGYAPAQYRLGKLYESGTGVEADPAAARQWTERAANAGNRKAMHNLGVMYAEGRGAEQDMQAAANWFEQAALRGAADSQFNLGILYEQGRGLPRSLADAYAWYSIAAQSGDQEAASRAEEIAGELPEQALAEASQVVEGFTRRPVDPEANGVNDETDTAPTLSGPAAVARAQALLISLGYEAGSPDGDLGPDTRMAIIQYQRDNGLVQSGEVSPRLLERLEVASARD